MACERLAGRLVTNSQLRWDEAGRWTMRWRGASDRLDLYHGTNFKLRAEGRYGGVVTISDLCWTVIHSVPGTCLDNTPRLTERDGQLGVLAKSSRFPDARLKTSGLCMACPLNESRSFHGESRTTSGRSEIQKPWRICGGGSG